MTDLPTPRPTGHLREGGPTTLVFERRFGAPVEEIWAEVTESDRLERWIARWTGDPKSGHVTVTLVAEGDAPPEEYAIRECSAPNRLVVDTSTTPGAWRLSVELAQTVDTSDGSTTILTFGHELTDASEAAHYGAGWEYYLDRLVVAQAGGDGSVIDFEAYSAALDAYYARLGPRTAP